MKKEDEKALEWLQHLAQDARAAAYQARDATFMQLPTGGTVPIAEAVLAICDALGLTLRYVQPTSAKVVAERKEEPL